MKAEALAGRAHRATYSAAAALLLAACAARGEELRLPVTKDNSIVLYPGEMEDNAGSSRRIRIKGNQHLVAMSFDARPVAGRLVKSATLVCRKADCDIDGVSISTIQCDWDEARSNALTSGMQQDWKGWGIPGARFPTMTGGNGWSLVCHSRSEVKDGWYRWSVAPDIIHANALGLAYGITIHEFSSDYSRNPTIFSKEEKGSEPYILVELGGAEPQPEPPSELKISDRGDPDSLRLTLRAPKSGFTYRVTVGSREVPRWNIPCVKPGEIQTIAVRDIPLTPGQAVQMSVEAVSRTGARSKAVSATAKVPEAREVSIPKAASLATGIEPPAGLAVIPVEDRYDAAGKAIGELPADYLRRNEIFDGKVVSLAAAAGEVAAFQLLVKGDGKAAVQCRIPGAKVELRRALYVETPAGRAPDPLVPLGPGGEVALSQNEWTPVVADVFVPFDARAGKVAGELSLSDGRRMAVALTVRPFALPREASFACEMNSYGLPNSVGEYYELQRIASDHRVHCNILHYSHSTAAPGSRKCNLDMELDTGRRMDEARYNDIKPGQKSAYWDDFAAAFGPFLTGERFKDSHRGSVSPPGFYLTFHESWPLNVRGFFNGKPDAFEAFAEHPEYSQTFVDIMKDFIAQAARRGWTKCGFQVYLNNKGSLNDQRKAPWILDEPTSFWDYRALRYYGELTRKAKGPDCPVRMLYRIDISRPEFDRGELWGVADLWVVSGDAFRSYPRIVADRHEFTGETVWVYGSSNNVEDSNRTVMAWALDAYRGGARGLVPWQTVNKNGSAMTKADQLGLFIFDKAAQGGEAIHHSMRLKAYRRAEQDIEYLELLRAKLKLTDGQVRSFVDRSLDLSGEVVKQNDADAGTARYGRLSPDGFRSLRESAAALIEGR